jgi:hypothetical protein
VIETTFSSISRTIQDCQQNDLITVKLQTVNVRRETALPLQKMSKRKLLVARLARPAVNQFMIVGPKNCRFPSKKLASHMKDIVNKNYCRLDQLNDTKPEVDRVTIAGHQVVNYQCNKAPTTPMKHKMQLLML